MTQNDRESAEYDYDSDSFNGVVNHSICTMEYQAARLGFPSHSRFEEITLAGIDLYRYEGVGLRRAFRRIDHIESDHVDDFLLGIPLNAKLILFKREPTVVEPGSFVLFSTSRPFDGIVSAPNLTDPFSILHIRISGALLRHRVPHAEVCCNHGIKIRNGMSRIMKSLIDSAFIEAQALSGTQSQQFSSMLIDAIASAVAEAPESSILRSIPKVTAHSRIFQIARDFIEQHLNHPELDAEMVAQRCRVSMRYLRAALSSHSTTVNTLVLATRLERCRAALRSPELSMQSITQIATSWGFNDHSYFTRMYRRRFNVTPSDERRALAKSISITN